MRLDQVQAPAAIEIEIERAPSRRLQRGEGENIENRPSKPLCSLIIGLCFSCVFYLFFVLFFSFPSSPPLQSRLAHPRRRDGLKQREHAHQTHQREENTTNSRGRNRTGERKRKRKRKRQRKKTKKKQRESIAPFSLVLPRLFATDRQAQEEQRRRR